MGIFNFVREAGAKVGLSDSPKAKAADAAKDEELHELREGNKLLRLLRDMDLGVEEPKVKYDDGVATIWGKAPSQKVRETAILAIGTRKGLQET